MTGPITWEALLFVLTMLGAFGAVIGWFLKLLSSRDQRIRDLEKSLADHKLYAAEHYATKDGLSDALKGMQASIDKLTSRLDAWLLERMEQKGRRSSSQD